MFFLFGVQLMKDKWHTNMWKLILPYSIVQPILLRFRHDTLYRVDDYGAGLINQYLLNLPISSNGVRYDTLLREERLQERVNRAKRICTGDFFEGTLRVSLCDVTLLPEEAPEAQSKDPKSFYHSLPFLRDNAKNQLSWWHQGFGSGTAPQIP